jgi:hypothetical protein
MMPATRHITPDGLELQFGTNHIGHMALGGRLYGPDGLGQFTGGPTELAVYKSARDAADAARLWDVSERLIKVSFGA